MLMAWLRRNWARSRLVPATTTIRSARLNLEAMEAREVPAALGGDGIALAHYDGVSDSSVQVVNATTYAAQLPTFVPFPGFKGALVTTTADVNGDGVSDVIVVAQNTGGWLEVVDGASGAILAAAQMFPSYKGQVSVGAADLSGQGYADVLIAASSPGLPVLGFDLRQGQFAAAFYALPGYSGPVSVSGADLNGTGQDQILVGVGGAVGVFSPSGTLLTAVLAFPGYTGPVSVAGGDVNGDGFGDIVVGGLGGEVKAFSGRDLSVIDDFLSYGTSLKTGVNIYLEDGNGDGIPDIYVSPQMGSGYAPSEPYLVPLVAFNGQTNYFLAQDTGGEGTYSGADSGSDGDASGFNGNGF